VEYKKNKENAAKIRWKKEKQKKEQKKAMQNDAGVMQDDAGVMQNHKSAMPLRIKNLELRIKNNQTTDDLPIFCREIIKLFNEITSSKYPDNFISDSVRIFISERINEGFFDLEDYRRVIKYKYDEWTGTPYSKYIRPTTLFGPKFVDYLNAARQENNESTEAKKRVDAIRARRLEIERKNKK